MTQTPINWQNRPTFQQADEIQGHRPFPGEPACLSRVLPTVGITCASATSRLLRIGGRAIPRGCGEPSARIVRVTVALSRSAGHGRCRFLLANGSLSATRSCAVPIGLPARGTSAYTLVVRGTAGRALPPGVYCAQATAVDAGQNRATSRPRSVRVPALRVAPKHRRAHRPSPRFTG